MPDPNRPRRPAHRWTVFGLLILIAPTACRTTVPDVFTDSQRQAVIDEVVRATRRFGQAERDRDATALLDNLDPSFYMYQDGKRVDYATTVTNIQSSIPALRRFEATFSDLEVIPLARDSALASFRFLDGMTDARGTTTRQQGSTTLVWRRRANRWRIIYADADHYAVAEK